MHKILNVKFKRMLCVGFVKKSKQIIKMCIDNKIARWYIRVVKNVSGFTNACLPIKYLCETN